MLIVGSGAREHAITQALRRSARSPEIVCAPGNAGIAEEVEVLDVATDEIERLFSVVIAQDESQAREALRELLVEHRHGTEQVLVEEHLEGEELSLLALCDGRSALPLASAQHYKRIFDGDLGPNTGGMGSYSPVPAVDEARAPEISDSVHQPVLDELARRGSRFTACFTRG